MPSYVGFSCVSTRVHNPLEYTHKARGRGSQSSHPLHSPDKEQKVFVQIDLTKSHIQDILKDCSPQICYKLGQEQL